MSRRARSQAGFTLVEVMISLSILALGLVMLLRGAATNMGSTQQAQMLTAATELARGKMYDLEEELLQEGFQELDQEVDGDFEEEGWPTITWEAQIVKIELPNLTAMQNLGADGEEGAEGEDAASASPLGGMLGMAGGLGGEDGGAGAGFIQSQFEIFRNVLEESIRKVTLTVRWPAGGEVDELVVDCYFTDPAAVGRVIGGAGAPAGGGGEAEAGDGDGDDEGGGSTRGGSTRGGSTRGGGGGRR